MATRVWPRRIAWPRSSWMQLYGLGLFVYSIALWQTNAHFMGDTIWYADNIAQGYTLWDAGHLFWRPLGALAASIGLLLGVAETQTSIVVSLIAINLLAGLVAVTALLGWIRRICDNVWVAGAVTLAFIFSQGFLNYTQTGSSYGAGLALLILGLYLLARASTGSGSGGWAALLAGVSFAAAMCLWLPYVVAVPAALLSPLLLFGNDRRRQRIVLLAGAACAALTLTAYLAVAWYLGITSVGGFVRWILAASRGSTTGGWSRMALGFARSFVNIERDGILFKRFLLHDPYNPVTIWDLLRLSAYKIGLFYVCLALLLLTLLRSAGGRRVAALLALSGIPALALAVRWQGGDMERYLALYPALLGAFAYALDKARANRALCALAALLLVIEVAANGQAMATSRLDQLQTRAVSWVAPVLETMRPGSLLVTLNQQDEVWSFNHSFPLHPLNQRYGEFSYSLSGHSDWQQKLAARVEPVWAAGGEVWLSQRLLAEQPQPDWAWVESKTQAVQWHEMRDLFSQLEQQRKIGGVNGFVLLAASPHNRQLLGLTR